MPLVFELLLLAQYMFNKTGKWVLMSKRYMHILSSKSELQSVGVWERMFIRTSYLNVSSKIFKPAHEIVLHLHACVTNICSRFCKLQCTDVDSGSRKIYAHKSI